MKQDKAAELLEKYHNGTCTERERAAVEAWYNFQGRQNGSEVFEEDLEKRKELIWAGLNLEERGMTVKLYPWKKMAVAAAVLLVIGAGLFYYSNSSRHVTQNSFQGSGLAGQDIKPGGNKAYLTLANGKRLSLTDAANGAVAKEGGVEISKTADGQIVYKTASDIGGRHPELVSGSRTSYSHALNTIETPRGGQYQVRLPDGSKVWLNAASKLIYPVSFKGRERREVSLTGEAYFEIFKNKLQPFVVKSKNQEVTVLGTHFNVNTYADEPSVKTTLLEGSVKVNTKILKPNEQSILKNNKIDILSVDAQSEIAWKNGFFLFKGDDLPTVIRQIARWYDLEVRYEGEIPKRSFDGKVYRNLNLSKALDVLKYARVHFRLENRTLIITP